MKYVLAPDSFKDSMTAWQVCQAMAVGIQRADKTAEITAVPMADGGEGTVDSLVKANKGKIINKSVSGLLGNKISAKYGLIDHGNTAVIETAQASGLASIPQKKRTPQTIKKTSTYGTGELLVDALKHHVKKIIIGLGGSGTNDGGAGMAQAIGVRFWDHQGNLITQPLNGGNLKQIAKIDNQKIATGLKQINIILASDVTNPLTGENGAAFVFGKQKGADQPTQVLLDQNLQHYAQVIKQDLNKDIKNIPGSGAAGGLGAAFLAFTNAQLKSGVQVVAQETKLIEKIKTADYVFTGEGGTDFQTKYGKTPFGVAKIAQKFHVPVISLAGSLGTGIEQLYPAGFTAFFNILTQPCSLDQALATGAQNIAFTCENIVRLIKSINNVAKK